MRRIASLSYLGSLSSKSATMSVVERRRRRRRVAGAGAVQPDTLVVPGSQVVPALVTTGRSLFQFFFPLPAQSVVTQPGPLLSSPLLSSQTANYRPRLEPTEIGIFLCDFCIFYCWSLQDMHYPVTVKTNQT